MNGADDGLLPGQSHLGAVVLRVTDIEDVAAFYRDVVGLATLESNDEQVVLGVEPDPTGMAESDGSGVGESGSPSGSESGSWSRSERARSGSGSGPEYGRRLLELRAAPDLPDRPADAAGLFHVAFRVPDRVALTDALERIRENWRLAGASDHKVSEALYLSDPEHNGVEVYRDRPRGEWPRTPDGGVDMQTLPLDFDSLPDAAGGQRVPAGSDVGHVHLEVTSLPASVSFYRALGMTVRARYGSEAAFLAAGDYHHHVGLNTWNHRTAPASGRGLASFEVVLPDGDAVVAAVHRLEAHGCAVEWTDDVARVDDQDGVSLDLTAGW